MARCAATEKTKGVLLGVVSLEARSIAPGFEMAKAAVAELMATEAPSATELKAAMDAFSKYGTLRARVENVLANDEDDTGTRNTAGGVITAIRKATGRNMVAEAEAALDLVNAQGGIDAVREHFGIEV